MKNPFSNAKVVADNVATEVYLRQEPGVVRGDPRYVMGQSSLIKCAVNPFKWVNGQDDDETASTEWGTLIDALLLDNGNFEKRFVVTPKTYPAPAKHAKVKKGLVEEGAPLPWHPKAKPCEDWIEDNANGRTVIKSKLMAEAKRAIAMLHRDPEIVRLLSNCRRQVMVMAEYHDKATGIVVPVKILVDIVPLADDPAYGKVLSDFKTSRTANPDGWQWQLWEYDYHVQGAFYLDVWSAANPTEDRIEFYHVVQENEHPYVMHRHAMEEGFLVMGRNTYRHALEKYCQCLSTKIWPSYPPMAHQKVSNGWFYAKPEEKMIRESVLSSTPKNAEPMVFADDIAAGRAVEPDDSDIPH